MLMVRHCITNAFHNGSCKRAHYAIKMSQLMRNPRRERMKEFLIISSVILTLDAGFIPENKAPIFASQREHSAFFHLFKVQYVVCFFASKGKWPFIPPFQQVKVDTVSRSLFPQSDSFIQNFCKNWVPVTKCYRPQQYTQYGFQPAAASYQQPVYQPAAELVTYAPQPANAPAVCSCTAVNRPTKAPEPEDDQEIIYFDKNHIGNISSETILNTIEFLESFVQQMAAATTTPKPIKRRNKNRVNGKR